MSFRMKLAVITTIGLFVVVIIGVLAIIVVGFLTLPTDLMLMILLIFGILVTGIRFLVEGIREGDWRYVKLGIMDILSIIIVVVLLVPTNNYTDWEYSTEQLLSPIEEEYIIDNENEYEYKVLEYSETGEEIESYKSIEKGEETIVEIVEINADEIATVYIFTRKIKSIVGFDTGISQTKYIFCIP